MNDIDYEKLNPGIRATVKWLRSNGFDTIDSGDGETHEFECDIKHPYVHIQVSPHEMVQESVRLYLLLQQRGAIPEEPASEPPDLKSYEEQVAWYQKQPGIEASYSPLDGLATISLFNVVLKDPEVA